MARAVTIKLDLKQPDIGTRVSRVRVTRAQATLLMEEQRSRIVRRTLSGVDADENPFKPYSTKGPIYVKIGSGTTPSKRARSAQALSRKVGRKTGRRGSGVTPIGGITPGGYLKAKSYSWLKLDFLGRSNVDLTGLRAPHMLQSMTSRVIRATNRGVAVQLGFQDPRKGAIASGNNQTRPFFGFGTKDIKLIARKVRAIVSKQIKGG